MIISPTPVAAWFEVGSNGAEERGENCCGGEVRRLVRFHSKLLSPVGHDLTEEGRGPGREALRKAVWFETDLRSRKLI